MDTGQILKAVNGYIHLVEQETTPTEEQLLLALDELSLASNYCRDFPFDEREFPEPPGMEQIEIRDLIALKFPDYGMYNLPEQVADKLNESQIVLGHAHIDLQEIYRDLRDVKWIWENNSEEDGLWHFHWGYDHHWGAHLRNLQWYLYFSRYEGNR